MEKNNIIALSVVGLGLICGLFYFLKEENRTITKEIAEKLQPNSLGEDDQIIFISDQSLLIDTVGGMIQKIFKSPKPGLASYEPNFILGYKKPTDFKSGTKRFNLLFFLATEEKDDSTKILANSILGKNFIKKALQKPDLNYIIKEDLWVKDQLVVFFFGKNPHDLANALQKKGPDFINLFEERYKKRIVERFKILGRNNLLEKDILKKHQIKIKIPESYELKYDGKDMTWFYRFIPGGIDHPEKIINFIIHSYPYKNPETLNPEKIIARQDSMYKIYVPGPSEGSYVEKEQRFKDEFPIYSKSINFKSKLAIEQRGLWRTENHPMGGPFVLYSILDEKRRRVISIEGFVFYPTESKKKSIQEIEAIVSSMEF